MTSRCEHPQREGWGKGSVATFTYAQPVRSIG